MDLISAIFIGFGLSMDCFAVSMSCAVSVKNPRFMQWLLVSLPFAIVQPLFAFLGCLAGASLKQTFQAADHWIAFALLLIIGGKMIWDAFKKTDERRIENLSFTLLLVLSVATSIDAFAVGISLGLIATSLIMPISIIAAVTFFMVMTGGFVGKNFSKVFRKKAPLLGGIMLILIGIKIIVEHIVKGI